MAVIDADVPAHLLTFKGKGGARIRLRELEQQQREIAVQMQRMAEDFKVTFRPPCPVHLVLHGQGGYRHLRWRCGHGGDARQTYVELVASEPGRQLLATVPISVRTVLLDVERVRLALNLASSLGQHELRRLREYLAKLDTLQQQQNRL